MRDLNPKEIDLILRQLQTAPINTTVVGAKTDDQGNTYIRFYSEPNQYVVAIKRESWLRPDELEVVSE